jgi:hypothetical protein
MNQTNYSRRDFLRNIGKAGAGMIILAPLHAIVGCGNSKDDSAPAEPTLASKFDVLETKVDGLAYQPSGQPPLQTNARHTSTIIANPKEDLTGVNVGLRVTSPTGKVDWQLYSPSLDLYKGVGLASPAYVFPIKNGPSGDYKLEWMVKQGDKEDVLVTLEPNVVWDSKQVASTLYASEAIDYLNRLFQFGANPGIINIVGDTAPASDIVAATEVSNRFIADAKATYGLTAPVVTGKLASEVATLQGSNGFAVGQYSINTAVKALWDGVGNVLPPGCGLIQVAELADGSVYLMVSGSDDLKVRQACRALATHDSYNMNSGALKVTGTTLTDLAVEPA